MEGVYLPGNFHFLTISGGWGSTFPGDLSSFKIAVCDSCLKDWVNSFKHQPVIKQQLVTQSPRVVRLESTMQDYVWENGWLFRGVKPDGWPEEEDTEDISDIREDILYEHFKGGKYRTLGAAILTPEKIPMVIYQALYGDSQVWARPFSEWDEEITREGYSGPRFRLYIP
jgi:hypothetical protein